MDEEEPTRVTTVLVRNLHCPSCVSNIEESLSSLSPRPISISSSVVTHAITIRHPVSLLSGPIASALEVAGFDIEKISHDDAPDDSSGILDGETEIGSPPSPRSRRRSWASARNRKKHDPGSESPVHIDNCDLCREELQVAQNGDSSTFQGVVIDNGAFDRLSKASLAISGMTCSSCVASIGDMLRLKPWVESANVNLLNNSADVTFYGEHRLSEIADTIEELGYEVEVNSCDKLPLPTASSPTPPPEMWRGAYEVEGMTCSSCVVTITEALKAVPWIEDVHVNLLGNAASVVTKDKDKLQDVCEIIDDLGYEAKVTEVTPTTKTADEEVNPERKLIIQVDGMHCNHCPERVLSMLETSFGDKIKLEKPLDLSDERLKIRYTPSSPHFTVRHILLAIAQVDDSFHPFIYHPPTLEERSRRIHHAHTLRILRKLILAFLAAIPAFIIGILYMNFVPASNPGRKYLMEPMWSGKAKRIEWALFFISTPVYFFSADFFHKRALTELWSLWRPGSKTPLLKRFYKFGSMDLLLSLGVTIAYFSSIAVLVIDASHPPTANMADSEGSYFDAVVFLTLFLLTGRILEAYSKSKAGDALAMLGRLRPATAVLVTPTGDHTTIPVDQLEYGDLVRIAHGSSPPFDGVVTHGSSQFDESSLTGESRMVPKHVSDDVFSGTMNKGAPLSIRITRVSGNSILDQIIAAVREGQTRRAPVERVADVLTGYFVPVVTYLAVTVWLAWLILGLSGTLPNDYLDVDVGGWPFWSLKFAVAVFVIACPCGIGLAAPTALFVGGGLAAKHGILVKGGGEAFQEASQLDCIVFDKTGTITEGGEPVITDHEILPAPRLASSLAATQADVLGAVRKLEESSSHPIAKAIVTFCQGEQTTEVETVTMEEIPGEGMKGTFTVPGEQERTLEILVGNETLMKAHDVVVSRENEETLHRWKRQGKSVALVAVLDTPVSPPATSATPTEGEDPTSLEPELGQIWTLHAILSSSDPLRPEAAHVISAFQSRGIETWMISGDNPTTAHAVASMVGIPPSQVIAGVLPEEKADRIRYLQQTLHQPSTTTTTTTSGKTLWSRISSLFHRRRHNTNADAGALSLPYHALPNGTTTSSPSAPEKSQKRAIIAMVGDGINDSPALTTSDVGIAIGSGSDIAISSAQFVLVASNLTSLLTLVDLSRTVFRRIKFNFAWALVYNLIALPVAAGVFYPLRMGEDGMGGHVRLDPVWASLAMAMSSISVVCSSLAMRTELPVVGFRAQKKVE